MNRPQLIAQLRAINERLAIVAYHSEDPIHPDISAILADYEALAHPRNEQPNAEDLRPLWDTMDVECAEQERHSVSMELTADGLTRITCFSNGGKSMNYEGTGTGSGSTFETALNKWRINHRKPLTPAERAAKLRAEADELERLPQ